MSFPVINQKEYLKKYLSLGSDDKKKKKRKKTVKTERFQVVDDDIDLKNMQPLEDGDYNLYELAEDAPQIAGFIDERPDEVKSLEVFRSSKWKIIQDEHGIEDIKVTEEHLTQSKSITSRSYDKEILPPHSDETDSKHGKHKEKRVNSELDGGRCSRTYDDDDESPPRKALAVEDSDESPPRNSRNYTVSSASSRDVNKNFHRKKEFSPSRKHGSSDRNRSYKTDSDESPPRTSRVKGGVTEPSLRKSNFDASSDESQQRNSRFKYDSDESQERSRDKHRQTSARYYKRENFKNIQMQGSRGDRGDSDEAPPREKYARRVQADSDESPPRKRNPQASRWDRGNSDESPPRKKDAQGNRRVQAESHEPHSKKGNAQVSRTSQVHSDESPPRKRNAQHSRRNQGDSDESPPRKKGTQANRKVQEDSDESPPRKRDSSLQGKLSRHFHHGSGDEKSAQPRSKHDSNIDRGSNMKRMEKQERTLDGKKAGLQDSKALRMENMEHNLREKEMFSKMSDEMSGRNAAPILRDRATGRKRDLAREAEEKEAEKEKENEKKQKYSRWGKGLKQVEDQQSRLAEDLYEMSKPLARYADDKDLEQHLKEQEREGDPMQEYIQNSRMKREKENKGKDGEIKEKYPVYKGPQPPPNRFGIRPGYRWDGVDRSTGYEHKWFQEQNARKALQEEAYKWSTEDM